MDLGPAPTAKQRAEARQKDAPRRRAKDRAMRRELLAPRGGSRDHDASVGGVSVEGGISPHDLLTTPPPRSPSSSLAALHIAPIVHTTTTNGANGIETRAPRQRRQRPPRTTTRDTEPNNMDPELPHRRGPRKPRAISGLIDDLQSFQLATPASPSHPTSSGSPRRETPQRSATPFEGVRTLRVMNATDTPSSGSAHSPLQKHAAAPYDSLRVPLTNVSPALSAATLGAATLIDSLASPPVDIYNAKTIKISNSQRNANPNGEDIFALDTENFPRGRRHHRAPDDHHHNHHHNHHSHSPMLDEPAPLGIHSPRSRKATPVHLVDADTSADFEALLAKTSQTLSPPSTPPRQQQQRQRRRRQRQGASNDRSAGGDDDDTNLLGVPNNNGGRRELDGIGGGGEMMMEMKKVQRSMSIATVSSSLSSTVSSETDRAGHDKSSTLGQDPMAIPTAGGFSDTRPKFQISLERNVSTETTTPALNAFRPSPISEDPSMEHDRIPVSEDGKMMRRHADSSLDNDAATTVSNGSGETLTTQQLMAERDRYKAKTREFRNQLHEMKRRMHQGERKMSAESMGSIHSLDLSSVHNTSHESSQKVAELEARLEDSELVKMNLIARVEELEVAQSLAQKHEQQMEEDAQRLMDNEQNLAEKLRELEKELKDSNETMLDLQSHTRAVERESSSRETQLRMMEEELKELRSKVQQQSTEEIRQEYTVLVKEKAEIQRNHEKTVEDLNITITKLKKESTAKISDLESNCTMLRERLQELQVTHRNTEDRLRMDKHETERSNAQLSKQYDEAHSKVTELQIQVSELRSKSTLQESTIEKLTEELSRTAQKLSTKNSEVADLQQQVEDKERMVEEAMQVTNDVENIREALRNKDGELSKIRNELTTVLEEYRLYKNKVKSDVKDHEQLLSDFATLQSAVVELKKSKMGLMEEVDDAKIREESVRNKLSSVERDVQSLETEVDLLKQENNKLRTVDSDYRSELETLRSRIHDMSLQRLGQGLGQTQNVDDATASLRDDYKKLLEEAMEDNKQRLERESSARRAVELELRQLKRQMASTG